MQIVEWLSFISGCIFILSATYLCFRAIQWSMKGED